MGFKFPGMGRKQDHFLTTQDVGRMDRFAHTLLTSSDPKAAPYKKKDVQLIERKGIVYIAPAKTGKKAAQRHEKALLYLADHFGSQVNQRIYGNFGQDGKSSNAMRAQAHLLTLTNQGSFSLEALCDALEPVSNVRRCANARRVSEVVVQEARRLGHEGRAEAADVDVRQAGDWFAPKHQSEAFKLTGEWIGLFQGLCAEASAHPSQGRRFLDKRFEETHGFVSCVWKTMGVEPARDTDMTLDTLGHQLLVAPEQRMRYLTSLIEDLHKMSCVNDQQEAHRNRQLIRRSAELMRTIRQAVEQRALVGNWLANELAPTLPGRLGQSAVAAGVNAVNLAARDMEPGSPFMLAYEWAAQNLRSAINERAAAQTKARCDEVLSAALSLVSTDLATGALGPALPPLTAEASSKAVAACDDARKRADAAAQRVEAWMWALPAQAPNADLAEQLRNGLQSAWAMFADDHGLPSDHAFAGLFNELPGELNRLSKALDDLRSVHEATPTGPLNEAIVVCSEEIVRLSSVYVGGLAAIGRFLANAALDTRWPRQWRNDALACGTAFVQLAQSLVEPGSHLMQIYNGARNAFLGARKGRTGTPPEPQVQGGTTSRAARALTVDGDVRRPMPLARRASSASLSHLEAEVDALLQGSGTSPVPRRPRADSAPSSGGRALPRKPWSRVRINRLDDLVASLKAVAVPGGAAEAENASRTVPTPARVRPGLSLDLPVDYDGLVGMSDAEFDRFIGAPEALPVSADHGTQPTPGTPRPLEGRPLADRRRRGASAHRKATGATPAFALPTAPLNSRRYRSPAPETSKAELDRYLLERDRPQDGAPVPRMGVDGPVQDSTTGKAVQMPVSQPVPVGAAVVPPAAKSQEDREQALAADPFGEWDEVLRDLSSAAQTPSDLSDAERKLQAKWDKQDADLKLRLAAQDRAAGIKPKKKGPWGLW